MSEYPLFETCADVAENPTVLCDICSHAVIDWNCELICPNCGARRDCSDP